MASMLSLQIQCSVCLNALRDPVCLPCQHSYCRICITHLSAVNGDQSTCPECRSPFSREDIRVNLTLRNIVDAARAHLLEHEALREKVKSCQCPDHHEILSLFCETDQKLVCVACLGEGSHHGHKFLTLSDAHQIRKIKTAEMLDTLFSEKEALIDLIESQADEIMKTREKSKELSDWISEQFKEMHKFLNEKEEEVNTLLVEEEHKLLEVMEVNLFKMEEILFEVRINQGIVMSALETDEPCQFLQWWAESGVTLVGETTPFRTVHSHAEEVRVIHEALFLGPYENNLKLSVCKNMLTWIQPDFHIPSTSLLDSV